MKKNSDINLVHEKYVDYLMKIPGVVGVYVGETEQKQACIIVMLKEETEVIKKEIPKELEGYPVILEVTGEIKPM
jgi:glyceraldehyde-3-phosphate dehydrogenase/erythrose-4-phosphate dehydrogenase